MSNSNHLYINVQNAVPNIINKQPQSIKEIAATLSAAKGDVIREVFNFVDKAIKVGKLNQYDGAAIDQAIGTATLGFLGLIARNSNVFVPQELQQYMDYILASMQQLNQPQQPVVNGGYQQPVQSGYQQPAYQQPAYQPQQNAYQPANSSGQINGFSSVVAPQQPVTNNIQQEADSMFAGNNNMNKQAHTNTPDIKPYVAPQQPVVEKQATSSAHKQTKVSLSLIEDVTTVVDFNLNTSEIAEVNLDPCFATAAVAKERIVPVPASAKVSSETLPEIIQKLKSADSLEALSILLTNLSDNYNMGAFALWIDREVTNAFEIHCTRVTGALKIETLQLPLVCESYDEIKSPLSDVIAAFNDILLDVLSDLLLTAKLETQNRSDKNVPVGICVSSITIQLKTSMRVALRKVVKEGQDVLILKGGTYDQLISAVQKSFSSAERVSNPRSLCLTDVTGNKIIFIRKGNADVNLPSLFDVIEG